MHHVRYLLFVAATASIASAGELYEVDTAPQAAPAAGSALDRVVKSMHVRACVRADVAPFGSFTAGGLQGLDIELAQAITDQISIDYKQALRVQWVVVEAGDRMKRVQDGACDILVAAFSHTKERAEKVSESRVYLRTDKVLVSANKITRKVPVIGKVGGTTGDAPGIAGTQRTFATYQEVIQAMDGDEVDYLVVDRPIADHLIRSTNKTYRIAKTLAENAESYVVAMHQGSADLVAAVDRALEDLARTGRLALIHRRWL
jgi:polar amino acid transport system substrate-binding protein